MYYLSVNIYIFESKDESQTNLIEKFEFESNQMVIELKFEFEPCDLVKNSQMKAEILLLTNLSTKYFVESYLG